MNSNRLVWTRMDWARHLNVWTRQVRAGQNRAWQCTAGQRAVQGARHSRARQGRPQHSRTGKGRSRHGTAGHGRGRQGKARQGKARQGKARQRRGQDGGEDNAGQREGKSKVGQGRGQGSAGQGRRAGREEGLAVLAGKRAGQGRFYARDTLDSM